MLPVIDDALLDVACPFCPAQPLELCTVGGRRMESTVHYPRRIRAGVTQPEPIARTYNTDPTKCRSGRHDWTPENTRTYAGGKRRCHPCAAERQRRNKTGIKRTTAQTKRPRKNVQHRNNGTHCRNGHEYTDANTYHNVNGRNCRQCKRDRDNRANAKKREMA